MSYCNLFLETEQSASKARDVWKKKPALKQIQNKQQQLIKATKQKKNRALSKQAENAHKS